MEDVRHFQDPCLPSLPAEPIPLDQGCSRQRFKQESVQSEPSDLWVQECVPEMKRRASHLDTSKVIMGHSSSSQEMSNPHLRSVGNVCSKTDSSLRGTLCGWRLSLRYVCKTSC